MKKLLNVQGPVLENLLCEKLGDKVSNIEFSIKKGKIEGFCTFSNISDLYECIEKFFTFSNCFPENNALEVMHKYSKQNKDKTFTFYFSFDSLEDFIKNHYFCFEKKFIRLKEILDDKFYFNTNLNVYSINNRAELFDILIELFGVIPEKIMDKIFKNSYEAIIKEYAFFSLSLVGYTEIDGDTTILLS